MYNITLVSSAHKEKGMSNSNELLKIIKKISPDVIYEELSPKFFSDIYVESKYDTLETNTIKRYFKENLVSHLPVDLNGDELVDLKLKSQISKMFNIFDENFEYKNLSNQHSFLVNRLGFQYLNSIECIKYFEHSILMEKLLLKNINKPNLMETYRIWLDINDRRENTMIKNIYHYGNLNKPKKALFLVGAAHIKSIIDKAKEVNKENEIKFNWIFNSI